MNLSFEINEKEVSKLNEMMADMGIEGKSMSVLFDSSLSLLAWAINEKKKGNKILSANYEKETQVELSASFLNNVQEEKTEVLKAA